MRDKFVYRELGPTKATAVMDYCERHNIEYDVWNAEEMCFGDAEFAQIGMLEHNWERMQSL